MLDPWRTTFPVLEGGPVQRVAPPGRQPLSLLDLSGLPAERREPEALLQSDLRIVEEPDADQD